MTAQKDVTTSEPKSVQQREANEQDVAIRPPVDIFEDKSWITLQADMPGVSKDRLDVNIDSDGLSIEGKAEFPMPEGMEAVHADVRATRYRRSFSLGSELDEGKIDASLKDGVLTLRIPKREEFQPRKIEVQTG